VPAVAKKNRASKADVQTTDLNRLPVEDTEFAGEYAAERNRKQKSKAEKQ
jgi:hypothetical protein